MLLAFVEIADAAVLFGIEKLEAVFPAQFGLVHGLIGLAQQLFLIHFPGLRVKNHAQTGADLKLFVTKLHRGRDAAEQALDDRQAVGGFGQIREDHHKFIAPQPGQGVAFTHDLLHAFGEGEQELVGGHRPKLVIDAFEVVNVEVNHRQ